MKSMKKCSENVKFVVALIVAMIAIVVGMSLSSCSSKVVMPVEVREAVSSIDTVRVSVLRVDTVLRSDTVCITVSEDGDTVRLIKTKWRERVSVMHDTLRELKHDTVYREKPVPYKLNESRSKSAATGWTFAIIGVLVGLGIALVTAAKIKNRN